MSYFQTLRAESRDLGEWIANEMDRNGLLSDAAKARLSSLNVDIASYIHDYISECQTDLAAAHAAQYALATKKTHTFTFTFNGRQTGAIGINYKIIDSYKADSLGKALWMLWTDYEHIRMEKVTKDSKILNPEVVSFTKMEQFHYTAKLDRK